MKLDKIMQIHSYLNKCRKKVRIEEIKSFEKIPENTRTILTYDHHYVACFEVQSI